jgi:hypothetical protein
MAESPEMNAAISSKTGSTEFESIPENTPVLSIFINEVSSLIVFTNNESSLGILIFGSIFKILYF